MATRESSLWNRLSRAKRSFRERLHMTRIENSAGMGSPDVEGCLDGRQFWLELKCYARPARPSTKIRVRFEDQQPEWLSARWRAGGSAFLLIQVGSGHKLMRYMIPADLDLDVLALGITEERLAAMSVTEGKETAAQIVALAATYRGSQ